MNVKQYFSDFVNYFIAITLGCILFQIITRVPAAFDWQNSILTGFISALIYTTVIILIKNKYRSKKQTTYWDPLKKEIKPILIIKTGSTYPEISRDCDDFEDWIIAGMGPDRKLFLIVDVSQGAVLPDYDAISGIAITGSHAMVTDHQDWNERTAEWLVGAIEQNIPMLGICYGHQLLAYALGGTVADNPCGLEFGTVELNLADLAQTDRLFSFLPEKVHFQATHTQSVVKLPPGAKLLASTSLDPNHAFVIGDFAWGVQFHPEFDADIVKRYIEIFKDHLWSKNLNPNKLIENTFETPFGSKFLQRFAKVIERG